jgi:hypothetical protein
MPRKPPLPPSPREKIRIGRRELKLGDRVKIEATITRIGDVNEVPSITVQLPNGSRMTLPAANLPEAE